MTKLLVIITNYGFIMYTQVRMTKLLHVGILAILAILAAACHVSLA